MLRNYHVELRGLAIFFEHEVAAVLPHQLAGDGQPEPGAHNVLLARLARAEALLEYLLPEPLRDADAPVAELDYVFSAPLGRADAYLKSLGALGVLHRVHEEVEDDLADLALVHVHPLHLINVV